MIGLNKNWKRICFSFGLLTGILLTNLAVAQAQNANDPFEMASGVTRSSAPMLLEGPLNQETMQSVVTPYREMEPLNNFPAESAPSLTAPELSPPLVAPQSNPPVYDQYGNPFNSPALVTASPAFVPRSSYDSQYDCPYNRRRAAIAPTEYIPYGGLGITPSRDRHYSNYRGYERRPVDQFAPRFDSRVDPLLDELYGPKTPNRGIPAYDDCPNGFCPYQVPYGIGY